MAGSAAEIAGQVLPLLRDLIPHRRRDLPARTAGAVTHPSWPRRDRASRWRSWKTGLSSLTWAGLRDRPRAFLSSHSQARIKQAVYLSCPGSFIAAGIDSLMAIPLGHHDRMLGVLLLGGRVPASFSGPQDRDRTGSRRDHLPGPGRTRNCSKMSRRGRSQLESLSHKLILVARGRVLAAHCARAGTMRSARFWGLNLNLGLAAVKKGAGSEIAREAVDGCLDLVARLITKVRRLSLRPPSFPAR